MKSAIGEGFTREDHSDVSNQVKASILLYWSFIQALRLLRYRKGRPGHEGCRRRGSLVSWRSLVPRVLDKVREDLHLSRWNLILFNPIILQVTMRTEQSSTRSTLDGSCSVSSPEKCSSVFPTVLWRNTIREVERPRLLPAVTTKDLLRVKPPCQPHCVPFTFYTFPVTFWRVTVPAVRYRFYYVA